MAIQINRGVHHDWKGDYMPMMKLEGEALKQYLMSRFKRTEAEALAIMKAKTSFVVKR